MKSRRHNGKVSQFPWESQALLLPTAALGLQSTEQFSSDPKSFVILKSGLKGEMPELRIFIDQHLHVVIALKFWQSQVALPRWSFSYNFPWPLSCACSDNSQRPSAGWTDHCSWNTNPHPWLCPSQFHKANLNPTFASGSPELIPLAGSDLCIKHTLLTGTPSALQDCIFGFHEFAVHLSTHS